MLETNFSTFFPLLQWWGGFVPVYICLRSRGLWHGNLRLQWDEKTLEVIHPPQRWRCMRSWLEEGFPALSQSDRQKDPLTPAPVLFCFAHSLIKETAHANTSGGGLRAEPCSAFRSDPVDIPVLLWVTTRPTVNTHGSIRWTKSNTGAEEAVKGEEFWLLFQFPSQLVYETDGGEMAWMRVKAAAHLLSSAHF